MAIFARKSLPYRCAENLSVIHLGERRVFLNEAGTAIWQRINGLRSAEDIASNLSPDGDLKTNSLKIDHFLAALHRLRIITPVSGPVSAEPVSAEDRPASARTAPEQDSDSIQAVQSACVTAPRPKGALSIKSNERAVTVEDRFNELYWEHFYIQKMHVEVTYRCNFRCVQCYNTTHASTETELSLSQWASALSQLSEMGCHTITLTGGEAFVRKDLIEILAAAAENGFACRINTNGSLITEKVIQNLERFRPFLACFDVSFYGATPEVHDLLARRPGGYQATLNAVRLLAEARMGVMTKFVTMRDNFAGVAKWKADMHELGVRHSVAAGTLIPRTDRNTGPLVQLLTDSQYRHLLETEPVAESPKAHFCRPGHIRGAITPDGHVSPCEWLTDFKFGNLKQQPLRDIWYSKAFGEFRQIFEQPFDCPTCSLQPGCSRCPAHSYLETGNLLHCAPSSRRYAELHAHSASAN